MYFPHSCPYEKEVYKNIFKIKLKDLILRRNRGDYREIDVLRFCKPIGDFVM